MKHYLLIISVFLTTSCSFSENELKKGWWKYGNGYYIGDRLDFNNIRLSNDTIYKSGIPKAILFDKGDSPYKLTSKKIIIQSLTSSKKGTYHQK